MSVNILPIFDEPDQRQQAYNLHIAVVKDVKDPQKRGRVRVECTSVLHDQGEKNWSDWAFPCGGFPVGSRTGTGDFGMWWPSIPGEQVGFGFLGGDYRWPIVLPFTAFKAEPQDDKSERIPLEAKAISDEDIREGTRIRELKSEAGHTLLFDDRGGKEKAFLLDWGGSGWFSIALGKVEDDKEKEREESKPRKGETRGVKSVMAQTSKKPGELLKGPQVMGHWDLNGNGFCSMAQDGAGNFIITAGTELGKDECYGVFMAAGPKIVIGAGEVQIQIDGKAGHVYTTSTIIQNQPPIDIQSMIKMLRDAVKVQASQYQAEPAQPRPIPPPEVVIA